MPAVTRVGDNDTGHDACPPRPLATGSPNVFTNSIPTGRVSDSYVPHGCVVHAPHSGVIAAGSSTVYVNSLQIGRIGDPVSCGGSVAVGSGNVFAGG
jgi:uncharacterized Zn-binding protein involved in type VI secretion